MEKHSSLLRKSVNYGQKSFITLTPGWSEPRGLDRPVLIVVVLSPGGPPNPGPPEGEGGLVVVDVVQGPDDGRRGNDRRSGYPFSGP